VVGGEAGSDGEGMGDRRGTTVGAGGAINRLVTGCCGDVGTDNGNGSEMWAGTGRVGDREARKRALAVLGWNSLDMVCWDFNLSSNLALYDFTTQFNLHQTSLRTFSQNVHLFHSHFLHLYSEFKIFLT
jgi:hypothetical protein